MLLIKVLNFLFERSHRTAYLFIISYCLMFACIARTKHTINLWIISVTILFEWIKQFKICIFLYLQNYLQNRNTSEDQIDSEVIRYKEERKKKKGEEEEEIKEALKEAQYKRESQTSNGENNPFDSDQDDEGNTTAFPPAKRGGRGRGSTGGARGRGGGRGSRTNNDDTGKHSLHWYLQMFNI